MWLMLRTKNDTSENLIQFDAKVESELRAKRVEGPARSNNKKSSFSVGTIINELEFPSLGARPPAGNYNGGLATTSYSSSSPLPQNHAYSKEMFLQRPAYANMMRNDGNFMMGGAALMQANSSMNGSGTIGSGSGEFHIQNEDFPALPGANSEDKSIPASKTLRMDITMDQFHSRIADTDKGVSDAKSGIQTSLDGTVTNIPPSMLSDQFGMAGLLTFLRAIESDPTLVGLALGTDLTTLGLNLNCPERNLYPYFAGPWADGPCKTQDIDAKVPEEYLTNVHIRDKLPNIKLAKLSEDVLFYLFYNYPGEIYQLAAAIELYNRDWRYHKTLCQWLTRQQYGGLKEQSITHERGSYNVFDPVQWRKIPKDMTLEYKELEDRPKVPESMQHTQQQPNQTVVTVNSNQMNASENIQ